MTGLVEIVKYILSIIAQRDFDVGSKETVLLTAESTFLAHLSIGKKIFDLSMSKLEKNRYTKVVLGRRQQIVPYVVGAAARAQPPVRWTGCPAPRPRSQ